MSQLHSNSTLDMGINVRIRQRDASTGETIKVVEGHNRVTKMALMGLIRFINGEYNETTPDIMTSYIPKYLALGSNKASTINYGVTTEVTVDDAKLLSEISPRIKLSSTNIENRTNNPYIKLVINTYIPVEQFVNEKIAEAGLFSKATGNNCWARITFDEIEKGTNTVLDITWEINVVSVSNYTEEEPGEETATQEDILDGKTATINNKLVTGTMPINDYMEIVPGRFNVTIPKSYIKGGIVYGDENLSARNIRKGVTIFGITGTYEGTTIVETDEEYYQELVDMTEEILGDEDETT